MNMEIIIRTAEEADFEQIVALFREFAVFERYPEKMTNSVERMTREKDFFHCFVAETPEKRIIGYATYFFTYYTWSGKSLYMDDLYVQPAFRALGIGSRLIRQVIGFAKNEQCHKLRWQVSEWNLPAIDFYKKLGANIDSVQKNCDLLLDSGTDPFFPDRFPQ
jgi:GNAT superfamily N-acetyltransferase